MKLVVTEKNDAAEKIAKLLSSKVEKDKVYNTAIYRFEKNGEEWVTIGLRGHILEPDFINQITFKKTRGWMAENQKGDSLIVPLPDDLPRPPFKKRKPFTVDGVDFKSWKIEALPYLVYAPIEKLPKEKDIIRSLKNLARKASSVCIATDFDREGELIGADALSCIQEVNKSAPVTRARYSSFTKEEITQAFNNLVELDYDLASAGESRQDIDLIWGAALTRFLTLIRFAGFGNVRSSGRVQTPTLALVVSRERERLAFTPEDYWVIKGAFKKESIDFVAPYKVARLKKEEDANRVMTHVDGAHEARVVSIEKRQRTVRPPAPFNTTSLMAAASAEGLSPARTMRIAENLYMSGYISYPRVDNTVYPSTLDLKSVVKEISANPLYSDYCNKILKKDYIKPTRGKKEDTDHPPVYPTAYLNVDMVDAPSWKLYNLIARRFLATLSDPAIIEGTKVTLGVKSIHKDVEEPFVVKGDATLVSGFREIYHYGVKKDEQLPILTEGDKLEFKGATSEKKQTEPPARYSQGRLIQEMEKCGLGTKSTRHAIIQRLFDVKYIVNDPIEPSQLGMAVIDALDKYAPSITHPTMTAELEKKMDSIARGDISKDQVVMNSRDLLAKEIEVLIPKQEEVANALADAVAADAYVGTCPQCGHDLQIRASNKTRSMFIGCTGWPDCTVTYPLPQGRIEALKEPCPQCGMPQVKVSAFRSKPRIICIDPECETNKEPEIVVGNCPVCAENGIADAKLIAQKNPRTLKRFIRCENYDTCNCSYPLPQVGTITPTEEVCPACKAPMVIVQTVRGPWKLCPNFNCEGKKKDDGKKKTRKRTTKKNTSKERK